MEKLGKQNRETPRVPFKSQITLLVDGNVIGPNPAKDLSLGGIFIRINHSNLKAGDCIIQIPFNGELLEITGQIRRVTDKGIGIQFTEMNSEAFNALNSAIMDNGENIEEDLEFNI